MTDNVDFKHKDYEDTLPDWEAVDDVCSGSRKFKLKAFDKRYLPKLNPTDPSEENKALNKGYLERAVLYPFVGYTLKALVGMAFSKQPVIELQPQLDYLLENADGEKVGLIQAMKATFREVAKAGRHLLWMDIETNGDGSQATNPRAFINRVSARAFINWRNDMYVIKETYQEQGEFSYELKDQWRVLRLIDGVYHVQLYRKGSDGFNLVTDVVPTDYNGNVYNEIPAVCVGAQDNSLSVDEPPLLELARISIAHFRDSADWQHSCFWAGQPQATMSGLTETWYQMLKDEYGATIGVGGASVLPLPEGGSFDYAQANPNTMPMESMAHHKELIVQMGGRLIEKTTTNTKIEAADNAHAEHSVLSLMTDNVESAYNTMLKFCSQAMGANQDSYIEMNKDFVSREMTPEEMRQTVESWMKGALPKSDMIAKFQRFGEIDPDRSLEEVLDELETSSGIAL